MRNFQKRRDHMNKERERAILELLVKEHRVTVRQLAHTLYTSEPSVRRDLASLEQQHLIRRVHGGAILDENGISELKIPFVIRELECFDEKTAIAEKAAALVPDESVIFLDASSSALQLVPFLAVKKNITVITSGIKSITRLAEYGVRVIGTGGNLINSCLSFVGEEACRTVRSYYADFCFFSCRGLSLNGELSDISVEENIVRREMITRAKSSYLLCAQNKIDRQYYHKLCTLSDIHGLITGITPPPELQKFSVI